MKLNREKVIVAVMALILVWYFKDYISFWGTSSPPPVLSSAVPALSLKETVTYENVQELIEIERPVSVALGPKDWGKDIFYDRSQIYKSWFKLTGISKMRDGYKAFINGEILNEGNRIRGFTITQITPTLVKLKKNKSRLTLKLE